jgi:hypothetical protein
VIDTEVPKYVKGKGNFLKMNPEYVALWRPYLDEGMSATAVGEIFGVATSTVMDHYPGAGWTPEQALAHSLEVRALNKMKSRAY